MPAVFGFLKYKNYQFVGSKKFLPPNLFIRGSVNLQEGWRLSKMNTMPYESKLEAFGWNVITIDGHDIEQILSAFDSARTVKGKPTAIVAKTVKGKGVSFMENEAGWHGKAPNDAEYEKAIAELNAYKASLK